ncbi:MAG: hypothetical protein NDF55_05595 [archaeon GB-1867-005]|nr:hypothetical protein [Candidatus Culexmicrobium cathedralense]
MKFKFGGGRRITCPYCGFVFDLSYARAFACSGCPSATTGSCGYVKCPRCGKEFASPR